MGSYSTILCLVDGLARTKHFTTSSKSFPPYPTVMASTLHIVVLRIQYHYGFLPSYCILDLKPENLLLSKSSTCKNIKVADFGMAAYTDPTALLSTSCGSPHYASPEVVEGKSYKGNVSDIWSCGVILYALLVGRLPFDHENIRILLEKVKMATYDTPKDVPAAARDLISRMLEKDVTKRITVRIHVVVAIVYTLTLY